MKDLFSRQKWEHLEDMSVGNCWEDIKNKIHHAMDEYIPKLKPRNRNYKKTYWMSLGLRKSVKKKYRLYRRFLENNKNTKSEKYQKYIEERDNVNKQLKKERKDHEKKIAENCKQNPKMFWKYINSRLKSHSGISPLKDKDDKIINEDEAKANILNDFFSSVFTREQIDNLPQIETKIPYKDHCTEINVSVEEVEKKLRQLNPNKAQGPDKIPSQILRELSHELAEPYAILYNKSLKMGQIPRDWKEAEVTAIFKKGTRTDPGNYRPVSLTCISCKVLEQFIRDKIVDHMNNHNLYTECQHGFRSGRSCMTQLIEVMDDLTNFIENKKSFDIIYLDFRKAFDSVPHKRLLLKLKSYGINGEILNWVEDFLTGRKQRVNVNGKFSSRTDVLSGIPQGSILGPVLFTIFINDLSDEVNSICKIFADDTKIYDSSDKSLFNNI